MQSPDESNTRLAAAEASLRQVQDRRLALRHLHDTVRAIQRGDDQDLVIDALRECLQRAGVDFAGYGVNLIEPVAEGIRVTQLARLPDGSPFRRVRLATDANVVVDWWRRGEVVYRQDLTMDDAFSELRTWDQDGANPRRAIVDVPFPGGTLAVNSLQPNAFSDTDIDFLQDLADVLGTATQRWQDLGLLEEQNTQLSRQVEQSRERNARLEQANQALAEKDLLLNAFHETGKALLGSIDLEVILDTLAMQVIQAGIFRGIMVALVDPQRRTVRVVRSLTRKKDDTGQWRPVLASTDVLNIEYDLDDDNITSEVARTARMTVIDGFDRRFDDRVNQPDMRPKVSYFIPVVHNDRTVAVLAVGSDPEERREMQRKIELLGPFFDLFAIALHHARLYRNLEERERQLRESQKIEIMGELTAGIAHNFNNLLQGVIGNLDFALEVPEEAPQLIGRALESSESLAEMVRQLMSYSRKGLAPERAPTNLPAVIESVVAVCSSTFDRRIEVSTEVDPELPAVLGNAGQLEQVLLNLCVNARDGVSAIDGRTPRIHISAGPVRIEDRSMVLLQVRDNGIGIEPAVQARIFDPFFTTKEVGRGTGLGLSNAQGIIGHHGGWISCDSTPGAGTTFSIYLNTSDTASGATVPTPGRHVPQGSGTILVIDDEEAVRRVVERTLQRGGYNVLLAADGQEGLKVLTEHGPGLDLVLLDLSMPRMSGLELLQRMDPLQQIPVVLFTGYVSPDVDDPRIEEVLEKPILPQALLASVGKILRNTAGPS